MDWRPLQGIVETFADKRVLIVGDLMLDEYIWGDVHRISPEAPVPVVEIRRRTYASGGAANTAANVVSLGGQALLCGIVGEDPEADLLTATIREAGVDPAGLVKDANRVTTLKSRVIVHNQQVIRIDNEVHQPPSHELEQRLIFWIRKQIDAVDACALSDYDKGVVSPQLTEQFIQLAREADKPLVVDPKGTNFRKYRGATVVTPNVSEAGRAVSATIDGDGSLLDVAHRLLELLDDSALLVTRGPAGMSLFLCDQSPIHVPTYARNVFDVTGAGDTVVSALTIALAAHATLEEAVHLANSAAGVVVGKVGTSTVTPEELVESLRVLERQNS